MPTGSLGRPGYHGITTVFGASLSYPVIRSRQQTLNAGLLFDALEFRHFDPAGGHRPYQASYDALRVMRLGVELRAVGSLAWRRTLGDQCGLRSVSPKAWSSSVRPPTAFPRPRRGWANRPVSPRSTFESSRTQTLFGLRNGSTIGVMGLLTGQWSPDILPPAEQFYLGGSHFTRGYYAGQVPGDKALAATVELQFNTASKRRCSANRSTRQSVLLFYDWGETWQNLEHRTRRHRSTRQAAVCAHS